MSPPTQQKRLRMTSAEDSRAVSMQKGVGALFIVMHCMCVVEVWVEVWVDGWVCVIGMGVGCMQCSSSAVLQNLMPVHCCR